MLKVKTNGQILPFEKRHDLPSPSPAPGSALFGFPMNLADRFSSVLGVWYNFLIPNAHPALHGPMVFDGFYFFPFLCRQGGRKGSIGFPFSHLFGQEMTVFTNMFHFVLLGQTRNAAESALLVGLPCLYSSKNE